MVGVAGVCCQGSVLHHIRVFLTDFSDILCKSVCMVVMFVLHF